MLYSSKIGSNRYKLPQGYDKREIDQDWLDVSLIGNCAGTIELKKIAKTSFVVKKMDNIVYAEKELNDQVKKYKVSS